MTKINKIKEIKNNKYVQRIRTVAISLYKLAPEMVAHMWKLTIMLENLEDFVVDGESVDHEWLILNRQMLEDHTINEMRSQGWIPVLDLSPGLTFEYNEATETFKYTITVKGLKKTTGPVTEVGILATKGIIIDENSCWIPLLDARL